MGHWKLGSKDGLPTTGLAVYYSMITLNELEYLSFSFLFINFQ